MAGLLHCIRSRNAANPGRAANYASYFPAISPRCQGEAGEVNLDENENSAYLSH
jgi:hypothetical protein